MHFIGATTLFFAKGAKSTKMVFVMEGELGYATKDCGPTVAPRSDSPKGSQKEKQKILKNAQKQSLVLRAF